MSDLEMILVPREQVERVVEIANRNEWSLDGDALARRLAEIRAGRPWIKWEGGESPVGGMVQVQLRCDGIQQREMNAPEPASGYRWQHDAGAPSVDIIAYREVGP